MENIGKKDVKKQLIVKDTPEETMVALCEDGRLAEVWLERSEKRGLMGNFYLGKVENVLPGMQAAFIDIGEPKNGFLYVNDAVPRRMDVDGKILDPEISIEKALTPGREILVQVMKEPMGNKGARITTHPTLPGRYSVLMPTVKYIGISRRIEDENERKRLTDLAEGILDAKTGVIIRTSAVGVSHEELEKDIKGLVKQWKYIQQQAARGGAPKLLHNDLTLLERAVRDIFVGEIEKIFVDSPQTVEKLVHLLQRYLPEAIEKLQLVNYDIMSVLNLSVQLDKALHTKIWLDCGGYLIIEQMEALTVIDVNTGKYVGEKNLENTVLHTNLEAASEIARQLRLRNLGGIIIVDFIDMTETDDRDKVLEHLRQELKHDRIKTNILGFTQLGLLEMTRKKNGRNLYDQLMSVRPEE